jgi:hypothetical protein
MLFRNTRVYPIQVINESGLAVVVNPSGLCELPEHIGARYDSVLEPVYLEAPRPTSDVFVIEAVPTIEESEYIDETPAELLEVKRGRGRPKKG